MSKSSETGRWMEAGRKWYETDAREALRAQAASGLSPDAFGREHGFSGQRLRSWRARLGEAWGSAERSGAALIPVVVRDGAGASGWVASQAPVVVRVGRAVIEVRDSTVVEAEWVARFVVAVGGGA